MMGDHLEELKYETRFKLFDTFVSCIIQCVLICSFDAF